MLIQKRKTWKGLVLLSFHFSEDKLVAHERRKDGRKPSWTSWSASRSSVIKAWRYAWLLFKNLWRMPSCHSTTLAHKMPAVPEMPPAEFLTNIIYLKEWAPDFSPLGYGKRKMLTSFPKPCIVVTFKLFPYQAFLESILHSVPPARSSYHAQVPAPVPGWDVWGVSASLLIYLLISPKQSFTGCPQCHLRVPLIPTRIVGAASHSLALWYQMSSLISSFKSVMLRKFIK